MAFLDAPKAHRFPTPTHHNRPRTIEEAISDLPPIVSGEGIDGPQPYLKGPTNDFQRQMRDGSAKVWNHQAMRHTPRLVERFKTIQPGAGSYQIGRKSRVDHKAVTVYKSNNQRLRRDEPSLCITANFQSTYVHPWLHRNLTAREAARLMTFPDRFVFRGKRTLMSSTLLRAEGREGENHLSQYNQIGNAVPPLLAQRIGEHLRNLLLGEVESPEIKPQPMQFSLIGMGPA